MRGYRTEGSNHHHYEHTSHLRAAEGRFEGDVDGRRHEGAGLSRSESPRVGRQTDADHPKVDGCDRADHQDDDLRNRPAHHEGGRPRSNGRPHSGTRGRRRRDGGRFSRFGFQAGRPGSHLLYNILRQMRSLPTGHVLPLRGRGLDPGAFDRRHPGRVCPDSPCRHEPVSHCRWGRR